MFYYIYIYIYLALVPHLYLECVQNAAKKKKKKSKKKEEQQMEHGLILAPYLYL